MAEWGPVPDNPEQHLIISGQNRDLGEALEHFQGREAIDLSFRELKHLAHEHRMAPRLADSFPIFGLYFSRSAGRPASWLRHAMIWQETRLMVKKPGWLIRDIRGHAPIPFMLTCPTLTYAR